MKSIKSHRKFKARSSPAENFASWLIVGLLIVIAIMVFRAQREFNPAVLAIDQIRISGETKPTANVENPESFFVFPAGFSELSPPEKFDENTLSDKINGKAELYLPAGFETLHTQRFKHEEAPDLWYEAFVYDMGSVLNAFSVFSAQRRENSLSESLAPFAYSTENAIFWVHGPYYAEVIASETTSETREHLLSIARAFNELHPVSETSIDEIDLFPEKGLIPGSVAFIPVNAFGFDGLDKIFTAKYRISGEDEEIVAFISRRDSTEDANAKADAFIEFMLTFGGEDVSEKLAMPGAKMVNFLDAFDAVATKGPFIAGVHEAPGAEAASNLLETILDGLQIHAKQ